MGHPVFLCWDEESQAHAHSFAMGLRMNGHRAFWAKDRSRSFGSPPPCSTPKSGDRSLGTPGLKSTPGAPFAQDDKPNLGEGYEFGG
jgi:hypothetical protein